VPLPQLWLGDTLAPFLRNGEQGRGAPLDTAAPIAARLPNRLGLGLPLSYARPADFADRRATGPRAVAARAADTASLCYFARVDLSIKVGTGRQYTPLWENPSSQAPSTRSWIQNRFSLGKERLSILKKDWRPGIIRPPVFIF